MLEDKIDLEVSPAPRLFDQVKRAINCKLLLRLVSSVQKSYLEMERFRLKLCRKLSEVSVSVTKANQN